MLTDKDKSTINVLSIPEKYKSYFEGTELTYAQFMDNKTFHQLRSCYVYYVSTTTIINTNFLEDLVNCVAVSWNFHCIMLKQYDKQMEMLRNRIDFSRSNHFDLMLNLMRICLEWTFDK